MVIQHKSIPKVALTKECWYRKVFAKRQAKMLCNRAFLPGNEMSNSTSRKAYRQLTDVTITGKDVLTEYIIKTAT